MNDAPRQLLRVMVSAVLAGAAATTAAAADAPPAAAAPELDEVIVTAQKRSENLQEVPFSLQVLGERTLSDLHVDGFDDYARRLTSLSYQTLGPGQAQLYVRGVANGGDATLRVGSQPLVGLYVDELPVTTIGSNLDVHVYDVQRVEALSGPQGTLFGASSMAGTVRIITNRPQPGEFQAGYDLGIDTVRGSTGRTLEGYLNVPVGPAAIRLVGWDVHDAGYVDNVNLVRTYPTSGAVRDNASLVRDAANEARTRGARAALRVELDEHWSVTPSVMHQSQRTDGSYAYTPALGDLAVARFFPERNDDRWTQAALTVEGRIANLDVVYSGGHLRRTIENTSDYSDYAFFYDTQLGVDFGGSFVDDAGTPIDPSQHLVNRDDFRKTSHELRIASRADAPLRFVAGWFQQRQTDDSYNAYRVDGLGQDVSIPGQPGVNYLNSQYRVDRDRAAFLDLTGDLGEHWTLSGGVRRYRYDNSVRGFFGFGSYATDADSPVPCFAGSEDFTSTLRPCSNIDYRAKRSGTTRKLTVTHRFDADRRVYATYSTGFRPGGVNRLAQVPSYSPDSLVNYELGWKTAWSGRLRFNGAFFVEKWRDAQFGIGLPDVNNITAILNAGRATIRGVEADLEWLALDSLTLALGGTWLHARLDTNACIAPDPSFECAAPNAALAPAGTRLPVSPRLKLAWSARYERPLGDLRAHLQLSGTYQGDVVPALDTDSTARLGRQPAYATVDLSLGVARDSWSVDAYVENLADRRGEVVRYASCAVLTCDPSVDRSALNVVPIRPRLVGVRFGQRF